MSAILLTVALMGQSHYEHDPLQLGAHWLSAGIPEYAMGWFREGLEREPWNSKLAEGLELARSQIFVEPVDPAVAAMLRPEQKIYPGWLLHPVLTLLGYACYLALCITLTGWLLTNRRGYLVAAIFLLLPASLPLVNTTVMHQRFESKHAWTVMQRDTPLRIGNGDDYPVIINLPKGTEARIISNPGGWKHIELGSGVQGWISNAP